MQECCEKCCSKELFVEIKKQKNGEEIRGLYCGECGKWQKWITKQELQVAKYKGLKIIQ